MPKARRSARVLTVGVVGPHDLVERIARAEAQLARGPWRLRLECLGYDEEHEVATILPKQLDALDSLLFTGPLPRDIAEQAGLLRVPSALLPLSGAALYSTLLRAVLERDVDIERVSIDSLGSGEVSDAFADLSVPDRRVRVMPYEDPVSAEQFADFHRRLYRRRSTRLALTTVRSVAERLEASDVPVMRMAPTSATIRTGLTQAVLMGVGSQLEGTQTAVCIVEIMPERRANRIDSSYWREDLRLAAHRVLLREVRQMGAMVVARDQSSYTVLVTLGPLVEMTRDFVDVPFVESLRRELGVDARVGIGLGHTLQEADRHAQAALAEATDDPEAPPSVLGPHGRSRMFSMRRETADVQSTDERTKSMFDRLLAAAGGDKADASVVLDAEQVANLLDVTPRTARRALQSMTDLGLVWSIPPQRSQGRGRPRQRYRLAAHEAAAEN